jgi:hypothetical protein
VEKLEKSDNNGDLQLAFSASSDLLMEDLLRNNTWNLC